MSEETRNYHAGNFSFLFKPTFKAQLKTNGQLPFKTYSARTFA